MALGTFQAATGSAMASPAPTTTKRYRSKIRLHVVPKSNKTINIKKIVHTILRGIMDVDASITFTDTQGESAKVSNFSACDSTSFDLAFGLVSCAGHSPCVCCHVS